MLEAMFTRIENAHEGFIDTLMRWGGITREEAIAVKAFYIKHKLVKVDKGIGRISVKHGAYLDKDVIKKAVKEATK